MHDQLTTVTTKTMTAESVSNLNAQATSSVPEVIQARSWIVRSCPSRATCQKITHAEHGGDQHRAAADELGAAVAEHNGPRSPASAAAQKREEDGATANAL